MAVSDHYKELTAKILRSDLETYDNAKNLMAMARHIRHECPDNKFCFDYITSTVKENWLSWALVSKDPRFEQIYFDALLFEAPYIVDSFFRYIEVDDKIKFYAPRAKYLKKIVAAYQELYDGKLDFLSVSQPKRSGKSSSALRLVAMFSGRHPEYGTLATGAGEDLVSVFYNGILKIFQNQRFIDVFPAARVKKTEAKRMNIDLQTEHMFPTVQCRPIDGAIVGSTEARNLLYIDDAVKNHEEAMNRDRLEFLDEKVTGDVLGRRIPGVTPILIQGTRYSLYDPIATLQEKARILKWRWKEVAIPALDPKTDKSNFEFVDSEGTRMFTTEDYRAERKIVTPEVWGAEFQQEPFEAKGRIFPHLNRFMKLPVDRKPDAVIFACDTAEKGSDFTSMPMAYVYGEDVFIPAVVYDDGSPEITKPKCANLIMEHKATSGMFESNSAGAYYGRDVDGMLKEKGYNCTILFSFSSGNKITRINEASNRIMEHFYFLDESLYTPDSDYGMFMREVTTITKSGKVPHDDASDSLAELDKYIRNLHGAEVKMISRKELGI